MFYLLCNLRFNSKSSTQHFNCNILDAESFENFELFASKLFLLRSTANEGEELDGDHEIK